MPLPTFVIAATPAMMRLLFTTPSPHIKSQAWSFQNDSMGQGIHLLRSCVGRSDRNINLEFTMKITRTDLESDPEVTAVRAQDILNRAANHAIASGNKLVRVSRVFTDDKCRQRRIIEEVGIYEHC